MAKCNLRIVGAFAEDPVAAFEDARGMNAVAVQAPRHLRLSVDEAGAIYVAGRIIEPGRGTVSI